MDPIGFIQEWNKSLISQCLIIITCRITLNFGQLHVFLSCPENIHNALDKLQIWAVLLTPFWQSDLLRWQTTFPTRVGGSLLSKQKFSILIDIEWFRDYFFLRTFVMAGFSILRESVSVIQNREFLSMPQN
jgi:hypothetical protein